MTDAERPVIAFERVSQVVCSMHAEPFRAAWPKGYSLFTVKLLQAVLANDGLTARLDSDMTRLPEECDRKPLCEWVTSETLLTLYEECGVGVRKRCDSCSKRALGTPYKTTTAHYAHICFRCVVSRFKRSN